MGASGPQARRVIRPSVLIPGGLFKLPVPEATADKTFKLLRVTVVDSQVSVARGASS
jgi:hypothetical protein